ncbi:hypothetical protein PspLS_01659 [Pyricularia sp. CBS 133598]|nr:hypothetical protein PspLS_01659 [Pyricularia sp. CBS 133598]
MTSPTRKEHDDRSVSPLNHPAPETDAQRPLGFPPVPNQEHTTIASPPSLSPPKATKPEGAPSTVSSGPTLVNSEGDRASVYLEQFQVVFRKLEIERARLALEAKSKDQQAEQRFQDRINEIEVKAVNVIDEIKLLRETVGEQNGTRAEIQALRNQRDTFISWNRGLKADISTLERNFQNLRDVLGKVDEDVQSAKLARAEIQTELKQLVEEKQLLIQQLSEARLEEEDEWDTDDSSLESGDFGNERAANGVSTVDGSISDIMSGIKTLRITVPIVDDLRDTLAEFSRLRRLGKFREAFTLFEQHLTHHLCNRYIQDQYGRYLSETGQLDKLRRLNDARPSSRISDALEIGWKFLLEEADLIRWTLSEQREIMMDAMTLLCKPWPILDSAEIRILTGIITCTKLSEDTFPPSAWDSLIKFLVNSGMIWEFRDLVEAVVSSTQHSTNEFLWRAFASDEKPHRDPVERLCATWIGNVDLLQEVDTSVLFAMLDILSMLSTKVESRSKRRRCLEYAQLFAAELADRDEKNMKTRPYTMWLVAEILAGRFEARVTWLDFLNFPLARLGSLLGHFAVFPKRAGSIYIPFDVERPRWNSDSLCSDDIKIRDTYQVVLQVAEENGDTLMQGACLQDLAYSGPENNESRFQQLSDFYSSIGNTPGKKLVNLFRYMETDTLVPSDTLRKDLLLDGVPLNAPYEEAYYMILRALSPESERIRYRDLAESAAMYAKESGVLLQIEEDSFYSQLSKKTSPSQNSTHKTDSGIPEAKTSKRTPGKLAKHARPYRLRLAQLPRRQKSKYGGIRARRGGRRENRLENGGDTKVGKLPARDLLEIGHQGLRMSRDTSEISSVGKEHDDASSSLSLEDLKNFIFMFARGVMKVPLLWEQNTAEDDSLGDSELDSLYSSER